MTRSLYRVCLYVILLAGAGVHAQTSIDLKSQTKNVDFSNAALTRPNKTGTVVPAACSQGETFFKTDAVAGQNLYGCVATNTWMVLAGNSLPSMAGRSAQILTTDGTSASWAGLGGDIGGLPGSTVVQGLRGFPVAATAPLAGEVLTWDGSGAWVPASKTDVPWFAGAGVSTLGTTLSVDDTVIPAYQTGAVPPTGDCRPGRDYYVDTVAGQFYFCRSQNTWSGVTGVSSGVASVNGASGAVVLAVGSAGTAPAWLGSTLNLPMASGAGVTAGLLARSDYDTLQGKVDSGRQVNTTGPLSGGGSLSADLTLQCPTCETTAMKNTANGYAGLTGSGWLATSSYRR